MCQFLLGKVLQVLEKAEDIASKNLTKKCQFLLGKVLQSKIKRLSVLTPATVSKCQFLLGKVLRFKRREADCECPLYTRVSIPLR